MTYLVFKRRKNICCICKLTTSLQDFEPVQLRVHIECAIHAVPKSVCTCKLIMPVQLSEIVSFPGQHQSILVICCGARECWCAMACFVPLVHELIDFCMTCVSISFDDVDVSITDIVKYIVDSAAALVVHIWLLGLSLTLFFYGTILYIREET